MKSSQRLIIETLDEWVLSEPAEYEFTPDLSLGNVSALSSTCKTFNAFFESLLRDARHALFQRLFRYVAYGKQQEVETILRLTPEALSFCGDAHDPSNRFFRNTSAFLFMLWALDTRYMGQMMLDCLPHNERGEKVRLELLRQLEAFEAHGVSYEWKDQWCQEKHYAFSQLIDPLQRYKVYDKGNLPPRTQFWCEAVGLAQGEVPAHVAQHYCQLQARFCAETTFMDATFDRSLRFFDWVEAEAVEWYSMEASKASGMGSRYAVINMPDGAPNYAAFGLVGATDEVVQFNVDALQKLEQVRLADISLLKQQLSQPLVAAELDAEVKSRVFSLSS